MCVCVLFNGTNTEPTGYERESLVTRPRKLSVDFISENPEIERGEIQSCFNVTQGYLISILIKPLFQPILLKIENQGYKSERTINLKAHVHPSGFARLSFCFGRVQLLNAVF